MKQPHPVFLCRTDPHIDEPEIGQTRCDQEARQPLRVTQMTCMDVKAAAFLVGAEGLNLRALFVALHGCIQIICTCCSLAVCRRSAGDPPPAARHRTAASRCSSAISRLMRRSRRPRPGAHNPVTESSLLTVGTATVRPPGVESVGPDPAGSGATTSLSDRIAPKLGCRCSRS